MMFDGLMYGGISGKVTKTSNKRYECRQNRKDKFNAQKQAQRIARRKQRG
jgi:hypothetical protein